MSKSDDAQKGQPSKCKSCGAEIIWAQTEGGKAMPVNALADSVGNIQLIQPDDPREPPRAVVLRKFSVWPKEPLYVSHFATCPNAGEHRRGR